jgi:transposase-like protein
VQLMIAVPLVVPDAPLTLAELEAHVQAWGQTLMRQGLAAAWYAQACVRPVVACPGCGQTEQRPAGHKPRTVETVFGPVRLGRQRVQCQGCGRHFQPDDQLLGSARLSPLLQELAALCGMSWPYRQAAAVLGRLRGAPLAQETVRAVVGAVGTTVAATQAATAAAVGRPAARTVRPPVPPPAELVVELDGGWVAAHDNPHGLEVKVGVVHAGSERVGRTRQQLRARQYAATARGVTVFGELVSAVIDQDNGFAAPSQTLLGDGAAWIWRWGADILPAATPVLDRWHLRTARRRALRAVLPEPAERAPWSQQLEERLERGDVAGALTVLEDLAPAEPHPALTEFAT